MPNHLHALILLTSKPSVRKNVATPRRGVPTSPNWSPGSLGAIINQFKSKCTKRIRTMGLSDFAWQSRCFDHIVRNDRALNQIRTYIQYNPLKWELDRYYIRA
jgi:REP element-mobilizing transposase RayT